MSSLELRGVSVRYGGFTAVSDVDLTVPDGTVAGLVGGSGSGKSTLGKAVVGLAPRSGGRILVDGVDQPRRPGRSAVQLVFQNPYASLDPRLSIGASIAEALPRRRTAGAATVTKGLRAAVAAAPLPVGVAFRSTHASLHAEAAAPLPDSAASRWTGADRAADVAAPLPDGTASRWTRADRAGEVARYLDLVGIDPARAAQTPDALSGGQRQRVALARALAARPGVLIADEITSALDVSVQGAVLNLLRRLQRELGFALLFISHDLAVVRYLCDQVVVLDGGRVVEAGPAAEVLVAPAHQITRTLLSCVPALPAVSAQEA